MRINSIKKWLKDLDYNRKLSLLFFLCFFVFAQIAAILISGAVFDTVKIISHAKIPYGIVYIDYDYAEPEAADVGIPYLIENKGIYNLDKVVLTVNLKVNYIDYSTKNNVTLKFFHKTENLGDCRPNSNLYGFLHGGYESFNTTLFDYFIDNSDPDELYWILGDFEIKARYFFQLIKFIIKMQDIKLL